MAEEQKNRTQEQERRIRYSDEGGVVIFKETHNMLDRQLCWYESEGNVRSSFQSHSTLEELSDSVNEFITRAGQSAGIPKEEITGWSFLVYGDEDDENYILNMRVI